MQSHLICGQSYYGRLYSDEYGRYSYNARGSREYIECFNRRFSRYADQCGRRSGYNSRAGLGIVSTNRRRLSACLLNANV